MRKLAAPKASLRSATVMAALRSADPSRAERSSRCYRTRRSVALDSEVRGTGRAAQGRQGRPGGHPSRSRQQPPRRARPLKGAVAIVARRRSSSPCTSSGACSSYRLGRGRPSWTRDASRPEGVRQNSPGLALRLGHGRARQSCATWSADGFAVARKHHGSRHLAPGAARNVGHQSSNYKARSLTAPSARIRAPTT